MATNVYFSHVIKTTTEAPKANDQTYFSSHTKGITAAAIFGSFLGLLILSLICRCGHGVVKVIRGKYVKVKRKKQYRRNKPNLISIETKRTSNTVVGEPCASTGYENQTFELQKGNSLDDNEMEVVEEKIKDATKTMSVQDENYNYQNIAFNPTTRRGTSRTPSVWIAKINEEMQMEINDEDTSLGERFQNMVRTEMKGKGIIDVGTQDISTEIDNDDDAEVNHFHEDGTDNLAFTLEENKSNENIMNERHQNNSLEMVPIHSLKPNCNIGPIDKENSPNKINNSTTINIYEGSGIHKDRKSNKHQSINITANKPVFKESIIYV